MRSGSVPCSLRDPSHQHSAVWGCTHTYTHFTTSPPPPLLHFFLSDPNWNISGTNSQLRFAPDFAWLLRETKNYKTSQKDTLETLTLSCPNSAFTQKAHCVRSPWDHGRSTFLKKSGKLFLMDLGTPWYIVPSMSVLSSSGVETSDKQKLFCAKHSQKVSLIKNLLDLKQSAI